MLKHFFTECDNAFKNVNFYCFLTEPQFGEGGHDEKEIPANPVSINSRLLDEC